MSVALVTGASGFIGSHLVEALAARGEEVRCLVRPTSNRRYLERHGARFYEGDVTDPESLAKAVIGVDVVYNLAGLTKALRTSDQTRVNGSGVDHVAKACAAMESPPVLVLVSSIAAAGPAPRGKLRLEADPPAPVSIYGRSKHEGEVSARRWADRVPTTIVRPGVVFGERDRLTLPMFQSINRLRMHAVVGFFPPQMSCIYAGDLAQILLSAGEKGERLKSCANGHSTGSDHGTNGANHACAELGQGIYNACCPEYPDYRELGHMLARALDRRFIVCLPLPRPFHLVVGGISQFGGQIVGRPVILSIDKMREAAVSSWAVSCEKARAQLGFAPARPLADRLQQTAAWYREQRWL